jgi:hypothetical protein
MGLLGGKDAQFYWHGPTLLDTLMANLPLAWVKDTALPAFLDRRSRVPRGEDFMATASPLWSATYAANGCLFQWDPDSEEPVPLKAWVGVSRWGFHGPRQTKPGETEKAELKALREHDTFRYFYTDKNGAMKQFYRFSPDSSVLTGLREWYSTVGTEALSKRSEERVLYVESGDPLWKVDVLATSIGAGMSVTYDYVTWSGFNPSVLDLDDDSAEAVIEIALETEKILKSLVSSLNGLGIAHRGAAVFWSSADRSIKSHLEGIATGAEVDASHLSRALKDVAIRVYDRETAPFRNPNRVYAIESSRKRLLFALDKTVPSKKESKN